MRIAGKPDDMTPEQEAKLIEAATLIHKESVVTFERGDFWTPKRAREASLEELQQLATIFGWPIVEHLLSLPDEPPKGHATVTAIGHEAGTLTCGLSPSDYIFREGKKPC